MSITTDSATFNLSNIPTKFASREIAATQDFRVKWEGKNLAIVITDFWHGSGDPQKALSLMLHTIGAAPIMADALVMMQASDESVECAKHFIAFSDNSQVIYDSTGTFSAMYPKDSFDWDEKPSVFERSIMRYVGPMELVPQVVCDAYADVKIKIAEDALCRAQIDRSKSFGHYFGDSSSSLELLTAKKYVEAMSCGMINLPNKEELGIDQEKYVDDFMFSEIRDEFSRHHAMTFPYIQLPISDNVQSYLDAIQKAYEATDVLKSIWNFSLEGTPFRIADTKDEIEKFVEKMDKNTMMSIADTCGALSTIDAVVNGVPLDDVLA